MEFFDGPTMTTTWPTIIDHDSAWKLVRKFLIDHIPACTNHWNICQIHNFQQKCQQSVHLKKLVCVWNWMWCRWYFLMAGPLASCWKHSFGRNTRLWTFTLWATNNHYPTHSTDNFGWSEMLDIECLDIVVGTLDVEQHKTHFWHILLVLAIKGAGNCLKLIMMWQYNGWGAIIPKMGKVASPRAQAQIKIQTSHSS